MANLKDVIYLSAEDYNTLYTNGTVTINGVTLTYDANNVYIVPDDTDAKISAALADYIAKSNTTGLVKNDGTIDTNAYITSAALANYIQTSNTAGLVKNDGTIDTNAYITASSIPSLAKGTTTGSGNAVTDLSVSGHTITLTKGSTFLTGISATTSGSGNAVTSISASGSSITVTKDSTFLTTHQTVPTMGIIINNSYTNCMGTSVTCSVSQPSTTTANNVTYRLTFNASKKWTIIPIAIQTSNYVQIGYCGNTNSSWSQTNGTSSQYAVINVRYNTSVTTQNINAIVIGV